MFYLYRRSFPIDFLPSVLLLLPPGAPLRNLCVHFIKPLFSPLSPMLPQADFFFLSLTHITSVKRKYRSSCRVITGCLSSTSISLLHLEALLPPLRVTLTHQSLSYFKRALRLPSCFPLASLAIITLAYVSRKDQGDHLEALLPPLRVTLTHQSLSYFKRALRLPSCFPLASLAIITLAYVSRKDQGDPSLVPITLYNKRIFSIVNRGLQFLFNQHFCGLLSLAAYKRKRLTFSN